MYTEANENPEEGWTNTNLKPRVRRPDKDEGCRFVTCML